MPGGPGDGSRSRYFSRWSSPPARRVRLLVLSHLVPPPPNALATRIFARGVGAIRRDAWRVADDGLLIELGSDGVETRELD